MSGYAWLVDIESGVNGADAGMALQRKGPEIEPGDGRERVFLNRQRAEGKRNVDRGGRCQNRQVQTHRNVGTPNMPRVPEIQARRPPTISRVHEQGAVVRERHRGGRIKRYIDTRRHPRETHGSAKWGDIGKH